MNGITDHSLGVGIGHPPSSLDSKSRTLSALSDAVSKHQATASVFDRSLDDEHDPYEDDRTQSHPNDLGFHIDVDTYPVVYDVVSNDTNANVMPHDNYVSGMYNGITNSAYYPTGDEFKTTLDHNVEEKVGIEEPETALNSGFWFW